MKPIVAWGKPTAYDTKQHAIVNLDEAGSVLTACDGRWSKDEPQRVVPMIGAAVGEKLDPDDTCGACLDAWLSHALRQNGHFATVDLREDITEPFLVDFIVNPPTFAIPLPPLEALQLGDFVPVIDLDGEFDFGGEA